MEAGGGQATRNYTENPEHANYVRLAGRRLNPKVCKVKALMLAASNHHVKIVELLAAAGVNLNQAESNNSWSALI